MKRVLLFLLLGLSLYSEPVVFNCILSPSNCTHTIYHPNDKKIPHPYYSDRNMDTKSMKTPFKAVGSGSFLYHEEENLLEYAISYTNLSSPPLMVHLQVGYPHQDGPIIASLVSKPYEKKKGISSSGKKIEDGGIMATNKTYGFIKGVVKLVKVNDISGRKIPSKEEQMLLKGGCYITIHTHLNELGELRGQINPLSTKSLSDEKNYSPKN
jgi:hypothetical protein